MGRKIFPVTGKFFPVNFAPAIGLAVDRDWHETCFYFASYSGVSNMLVSGVAASTTQVKRWAPTDPAVDAPGVPAKRDVASRLIDNLLMAKYSADNLRGVIADGVEHTRGMVALVASMMDNLPAGTSEADWQAWQREAAGQQSQLRYLEEEKETLAWRDQNYEKMLPNVMSRVGSLMSPDEAATLFAERQAAFEERFPARETAESGQGALPSDSNARSANAGPPLPVSAAEPGEVVERYRATWLLMLSLSLSSSAEISGSASG